MEFIRALQDRHDSLKPSLFDILAENQLSALIAPALRYLLVAATHRHPRYLLRILNSFDEIYALLSAICERHFLKSYGSTFTENFYGLKRERVLSLRGGEALRSQIGAPEYVREALKLRGTSVWKNLAVVVGIPYLQRKLDQSYEIHAAHHQLLGSGSAAEEQPPPGASLKERFMYWYKWFLRRVYPNVNAAFYFSSLTFQLAYLFDGTKYSSPLLWLIGTRIRRMGPADYRAIDDAESKAVAAAAAMAASGRAPGIIQSLLSPRLFAQTVVPKVLSSLRLVLPASIFALKFLEWWHASDFSRQLARKATEGLELPPPAIPRALAKAAEATPGQTKPEAEGQGSGSAGDAERPQPATVLIQRNVVAKSSGLPILTVPAPSREAETAGQCPICSGQIENPTAAPSGFVFCYVCIHKWVDGTHDLQEQFMQGQGLAEGDDPERSVLLSREGEWEDGRGRCAVTGMALLAGSEGLRRVII